MSFQKTLVSGPAGSVSISEAAGVVTLSASLSADVGGGSVAGALQASASVSVQLSATQLINAALALAADKFPSLASEIGLAQSAIDAELAKA